MSTTAAAPIGRGTSSPHHFGRWLVAIVVFAAAIGLTVWLLVRSSTNDAKSETPVPSTAPKVTAQLPAACHPRRVGGYVPC
jgi:hypothetical protein